MVTNWIPVPDDATVEQRRTLEALDEVVSQMNAQVQLGDIPADRLALLVYSDGERMTSMHSIGYEPDGTPFPLFFSRYMMRPSLDAFIAATPSKAGRPWHVAIVTLDDGTLGTDFVRDNPQDWVMTPDSWSTIAERVRPH